MSSAVTMRGSRPGKLGEKGRQFGSRMETTEKIKTKLGPEVLVITKEFVSAHIVFGM